MVQVPKKAEGAAPTNTIFIKNLPYEITEDEVGDFFRPCGSVDNVRLVYNSFKKHFKGYNNESCLVIKGLDSLNSRKLIQLKRLLN